MARKHHYIDPDKFAEVVVNYLSGFYRNQVEAAKGAEMSVPTFRKYLKMLLEDKEFPKSVFIEKK